jgi:hypothetical protein
MFWNRGGMEHGMIAYCTIMMYDSTRDIVLSSCWPTSKGFISKDKEYQIDILKQVNEVIETQRSTDTTSTVKHRRSIAVSHSDRYRAIITVAISRKAKVPTAGPKIVNKRSYHFLTLMWMMLKIFVGLM